MIVLKFATEIKGDSVVTDHADWITIDSIQMGVGRAISSSGGGADRETSTPSFSEITLTKSFDKASTELFAQSIYGKSLGKAEIHFIQTGGTGAESQVYLKIELKDAIVSSYSMSSGGDRPTDSFSLNFVQITMQYTAFSGAETDEGTAKGWDLKVGNAIGAIS